MYAGGSCIFNFKNTDSLLIWVVLVLLYCSHYTNELVLRDDNSLDARTIKDTFSFDYGFKGKYKVHLQQSDGKDGRIGDVGNGNDALFREIDGQITRLISGTEYWCVVEEDPEIERGSATYTAPKKSSVGGSSGGATANLTEQLKGLSTDELKEQSAR